jgi:hypothetical protein
MYLVHRYILKGATWVFAALALWIGWPNTSCQCADGGFKFFCDAHQNGPGSTVKPDLPPVNHIDCCLHRGWDNQEAVGSSVLSGMGCTPLAKAPIMAPTPASNDVNPPTPAVPYLAQPAAAALVAIAQPATLPDVRETGPPLDIVTELHRLLL